VDNGVHVNIERVCLIFAYIGHGFITKTDKSQTSSVVYRSVAQTSSDFPDLRPKSIISINYEINQIILHI
jgi:hypothetical protein